MRVRANNASGGGGGNNKKSVTDTFTWSSGTKTVTVSGMTNIEAVCWRMPYYTNNYGYAMKYGAPYNDTIHVAVNGSSLYSSEYAVQSISGNTFTFYWGSSNTQTFEYTVYGE